MWDWVVLSTGEGNGARERGRVEWKLGGDTPALKQITSHQLFCELDELVHEAHDPQADTPTHVHWSECARYAR